jgi:DNA helicase-4
MIPHVFDFKALTAMSETYFQVVLTGDGIKQLFSLVRCEKHGQLLVGSTVDNWPSAPFYPTQKVTRIGVSSSSVNTVAVDNGAYNPERIFGTTLTVHESAVRRLSESTPELKEFFSALLTDKRLAAERCANDARVERERRTFRSRVLDYAGVGDLILARKTYEDHCADWWTLTDYEQALCNEVLARQFVTLLKGGPLHAIDRFFIEHLYDQLSDHELARLKLPLLRLHLDKLGVTADAEQELAIASPCRNVQITARAGSGKTRTLAARAALSITDEKLNPDQVLILAFNKSAAAEIKARVQKLLNGIDYVNTRTFHSLAHQLAKPENKILFDKGGSVSTKEQSQFAQRMLRRILNPAFQEEMVRFFREEMEQIESIGRDLPPEDYFIFRRSLEHVTLGGQWVRASGEKVVTNGERVKSKGEKFIADFLFEHDVSYRYERAWMWKTPFLDGTTYKPDFSIVANGYDYILEHWAFNPDDPNAELPAYWSQTAEQYSQQIQAKRQFWASKNITLLETHAGMLANGRQAFEELLKSILERADIRCTRLAEAEIVKRVFQNDFMISRMAGMFIKFIQRSKNRGWSPDKLAEILKTSKEIEPRTKTFHRLALRAYREYELMKQEESAIDFDDLLLEATKAVVLQGANATIHLGAGRTIALADIKWILLDEYQDFTRLFFQMLEAVLTACPGIRVVAVGDDWQAINSFAGAELTFFQDFAKFFPGGATVGITTNYRSGRNIVTAGNRVLTASDFRTDLAAASWERGDPVVNLVFECQA